MLLNLHGRDLDGTAAIFRANVITPGTNGLNSNYDRDRVPYNQGGGNPQAYKGWGASANVGYDFGDMRADLDHRLRDHRTAPAAATSTAASPASARASSRSTRDTQDSIDDLDQITQEFRLASDIGGPLSWQVGAY